MRHRHLQLILLQARIDLRAVLIVQLLVQISGLLNFIVELRRFEVERWNHLSDWARFEVGELLFQSLLLLFALLLDVLLLLKQVVEVFVLDRRFEVEARVGSLRLLLDPIPLDLFLVAAVIIDGVLR